MSTFDGVLKRFADFDIEEFQSNIHGFDIKSVRQFKNQLRMICESADLIRIAKKRNAGEDFDPKLHDDSDTVVDRLISIIVHEKIQLEKDKRIDQLDREESERQKKAAKKFMESEQ